MKVIVDGAWGEEGAARGLNQGWRGRFPKAHWLLVLLLAGSGWPARAIVFMDTADGAYNSTAPSGLLVDSGWQFEGSWSGFLGTPISPNLFLTAKHVGGTVGDSFTFNSVSYTTVASYASPDTDLQLWQVNTPFSSYAPLYTKTDEVGKDLVVIGRGVSRGADVLNLDSQLAGWRWGSDARQRWGENTVSGLADGGPTLGQLLRVSFDQTGGANEAHLANGDSGGGVFIQDGGVWKLAGINYGVDAKFSTTGIDGSGFDAALFDMGGLYQGGDGAWTFQPNVAGDVPSAFYATRISANQAWINGVVAAVPEPRWSGWATALVLAAFGFRRRGRFR